MLRVGFSGTATYRLMPMIVQAARKHMPGLRLNVQGEMLTPEMEIALEEQRVDVAVLATADPVQPAEPEVPGEG